MALSSAIRIESSFYLVLVLGIPLIVDTLVHSASPKWRVVAILVLVTTTAVALDSVDYYSYQRDTSWKDYRQENELRAAFNEYNRVSYNDTTAAVFRSVGWNKLDYKMIKTWFYADADRFSIDKLQKIVGAFPDYRTAADWPKLSRRLLGIVKNKYAGAALLLIVCQLLSSGFSKRRFWISGATVVLVAAAFIGLAIFVKVPTYWVLFPVFAYLAFLGVYYWPRRSSGEQAGAYLRASRIAAYAGIAVVLAVSVISCREAFAEGIQKMHEHRVLTNDIRQATASQRNALYIVWGNSVVFDAVSPLKGVEDMAPLTMVVLGATLHSPITRERLAAFHIHKLAVDLVRRNDLYLIADKKVRRNLLAAYLRDHYGITITYDVHFSGGLLTVYKVRREKSQPFLRP